MEDINLIVVKLRKLANDKLLENKEILMPKNELNLKEGTVNVGKLIYFIADMLEE